MCWFSVEYEKHVEQAKAGQRLGIRTISRSTNWHANWVVNESELESAKPCPVCLTDQTRVLFRFSESHQMLLHIDPEVEATFKMLKCPKRDIFEFADGRRMTLTDLPTGLIFDVLVVPGSERFSAVFEEKLAVEDKERAGQKETFLERVLAHF